MILVVAMRVWLGSAMALCMAVAAQAADVNDPVWDQAPSQDAWSRAYPAHAASAGIAGAVKIKCAAISTGHLAGCSVIQEAPIGEGFGAAALSLATQMALKPTDGAGQPVAGRNLIVPVKFDPALLHNAGAVISQPDWLRRPTGEEFMHYLPAHAAPGGGRATLLCVVSSRGLLDRCEVTGEQPEGHGYGSAVLAMSSLFTMRPMTVDGQPVGGARIVIPIRFGGSGSSWTGGDISVLRRVPWLAAPSAENMAEAFPRKEVGKIASAHVVLRCELRADGGVNGCEPLEATPPGRGFDTAALRLTKYFRVAKSEMHALWAFRVDIPFDFHDPSSTKPPEVYDPIWIRAGDSSTVALFPQAAAKAGVSTGEATATCTVRRDGSLGDCVARGEQPSGLGFGDAALNAASVLGMSPWSAQGAPVEGARISIPFKFVAPVAEAPGSSPPQPAVRAK
ncbi:MAG TPA: energy transducer TonB [Caulobacteraceae bacterium]|jgi:outer membrane biosynthesis protein TonB|nr:energy transducer TonB [Caulobacteraceae bacterium]